MKDLISREALLKSNGLENAMKDGNKDAASTFNSYEIMLRYEVADMIKEAPAVDAVEVVRCKDCMFSILIRDSDLRYESPWCYCNPGCRVCRCKELIEDEPIIVEDDFFCKYGAKMDEEGEANEQGANS